MLERLIYTLLDDQIQRLAANPDKLRLLLRHQNRLSSAEEDALVEAFSKTPFKVFHDLAQAHQTFPNICIVLGQEEEDREALGDLGGVLTLADAQMLEEPAAADQDYLASLYSRRYDLYVHAMHPDMVIAGYDIAKMLLTFARREFSAEGALNTKISGSGLTPIPLDDGRADFIFRRVLHFTALETFGVVDLDGLGGLFSSVGGLHVAGGSTSSPGSVTTLVTPTGEN